MRIIQSVSINASPERIYSTMISGDEFGKATGVPADISREEGGTFSCFGGQVIGRHLELRKNQRIVQAWRVGPWPEGSYSIVKFDLSGKDNATIISLEHAGFPEDAAEHLESGWHKMYWQPLKAYLE